MASNTSKCALRRALPASPVRRILVEFHKLINFCSRSRRHMLSEQPFANALFNAGVSGGTLLVDPRARDGYVLPSLRSLFDSILYLLF